jgi:hypothetical protein
MLYRRLPKQRPWWDGRVARQYEFSDYVFRLLWNVFFPRLDPEPANDRDHLRW